MRGIGARLKKFLRQVVNVDRLIIQEHLLMRSMVTTIRCSVICLTVRVLGTLTSIPDCKTGSVIIKITSSTSTTSTSGVMLISASEDLFARCWL